MAHSILTLAALCLHFLVAHGQSSSGRIGYGLIGYGIDMYDPECAYSCRSVLSSSALNCSTYSGGMDDILMMDVMDMSFDTSPECFATDNVFLQSLAWCISTRCDGIVSAFELEKYWLLNVAGRLEEIHVPKITYEQALAAVVEDPTEVLVMGDPLKKTSLIGDEDYIETKNAQTIFEKQEIAPSDLVWLFFSRALSSQLDSHSFDFYHSPTSF